MKKLNRRVAAALLSLAAGAASAATVAQESGFVLEDSIRRQVFEELKNNVNSLYRHSVAETRQAAIHSQDLERGGSAAPLRESGERRLRDVAREDNIGSGTAL